MAVLRTEMVSLPTAFFRDLGEAESISAVLDVVATWLPSIVDGERASVALATADGDALEVYAMGGNHAIAVGSMVPSHGSLIGQVFRNRRAINFTEFGPDDGDDAAMLFEGGLRTCLDAPLLSNGRCFGTLNVAHSQPGHFDASAFATMEAVARLVATTINAHRHIEHKTHVAEIDPLTGIASRRTFDHRSIEAWNALNEPGQPFGLALFDLDDFTAITDRYGCDAGDAVLRSFATLLQAGVRGGDIVARLGGHEFGVLLAGMSHAHLTTWADRLRARVASASVAFGDTRITYTTTIGVSVAMSVDRSFDEVYRRADQALYAAKRRGRDCVVAAA